MANTALSDICQRVAVSPGGEKRIPAFGNGSVKPGSMVAIDATTHKVKAATATQFDGILEETIYQDIDEAITDAEPCNVIEPTDKHEYNVWVADAGASKNSGAPLELGASTALAHGDAMDNYVAKLKTGIVDDDTVATIVWGK